MFPNSEYIFVKNISDGIDEYKQVTRLETGETITSKTYRGTKPGGDINHGNLENIENWLVEKGWDDFESSCENRLETDNFYSEHDLIPETRIVAIKDNEDDWIYVSGLVAPTYDQGIFYIKEKLKKTEFNMFRYRIEGVFKKGKTTDEIKSEEETTTREVGFVQMIMIECPDCKTLTSYGSYSCAQCDSDLAEKVVSIHSTWKNDEYITNTGLRVLYRPFETVGKTKAYDVAFFAKFNSMSINQYQKDFEANPLEANNWIKLVKNIFDETPVQNFEAFIIHLTKNLARIMDDCYILSEKGKAIMKEAAIYLVYIALVIQAGKVPSNKVERELIKLIEDTVDKYKFVMRADGPLTSNIAYLELCNIIPQSESLTEETERLNAEIAEANDKFVSNYFSSQQNPKNIIIDISGINAGTIGSWCDLLHYYRRKGVYYLICLNAYDREKRLEHQFLLTVRETQYVTRLYTGETLVHGHHFKTKEEVVSNIFAEFDQVFEREHEDEIFSMFIKLENPPYTDL